jgi:DNA-binding transcriptional LysR family regulator
MLNISHRQLRAFLLIARLKNFSRAADQLHIAQSGLSLMVRELEEQLGFRLFNRTTRHVSLTELGAQLLPVAERNVQELEAVAARLGATAKVARQTLTVGAPPQTCANLLPELIARFATLRPDVRVKVVDADIGSISSLVQSGEVDLGFGMFIKPAPSITRLPLFQFSLALVQSYKSSRASDEPVTWASLKDAALIALPSDNPLQQLIDRHLAEVGHHREPSYVVNFIDTQLGLAAAGCGVAIVPTTAFQASLHRRLSMQAIIAPAQELAFYEVRSSGRKLPDCAEEFTTLLQSSFAHRARGSLPVSAKPARARRSS